MAKNPDIELLFGVLGGGSVDGESGSLIKGQLNTLVRGLNKSSEIKERSIKLNLDTETTRANFKNGIKSITTAISTQKQFNISISEIKADSAIENLKKQLNSVLKTIQVDTGFTVSIGENGASSAVKNVAKDAEGAVLSLTRVEAVLKEIGITNSTISKDYKSMTAALGGAAATGQNASDLEQLKQKYLELQTVINVLNENKATLTQDEVNGAYAAQEAVQEQINAINKRIAAEKQAAEERKKASKDAEGAADREKAAEDEVNKTMREAITLQKRMQSAIKNFTSASKDAQGSKWYQSIVAGEKEISSMISGVSKLNKERLSQLSNEFNNCEGHIRAAGLASKSFGDVIVSNAKKFTSWFSVSQIIMRSVSELGKMVQAVKDVDTAMTELRKVTDETDATYTKFLDNAAVRAKELGATLADTVNATADFSRLGYTIAEASELADAALVYKNVGDGIEDIGDASESLISTMRGFNLEASEAMSIIDKFNEVGNRFPISSKGIGDALMRSAAALSVGNNTLEESIALVTTANSVVQDSDKVGTTLKTISMYLRAAKTEAEEAGESTDGMAESVSELRSEILSLTGGKVDIQIDEDNFKSSYQILKEIAGVWDELTDITQANILEMLGGKRNSNVVAALISNFDMADEVVEVASNAAGSALAENEKYLDSIAGRISVFSATFEEFSTTLIDSELVKTVVDLGTALLGAANTLAEIKVILPSITAALVAYATYRKQQKLSLIVEEEAAAVDSFVKSLLKEKEVNDILKQTYKGFNEAQQKSIAKKIADKAATGEMTAKESAAITVKLADIAATNTLTASTTGLGAAIKGLLASIGPAGWVMIALSTIPAAVNLVGSALGNIGPQLDSMIQKGEELKSTYSGGLDEVGSNLQTLQGFEDEFYALSDGVDTYGDNISLAADDYSRYQDIVATILEISPSLVAGYDAEGNAIANKNGLLEKAIALMKEEQRLKLKNLVATENATDIGMGEVATIKEYGLENAKSQADALAKFGSLFGNYVNKNGGVNAQAIYSAFDLSDADGWFSNSDVWDVALDGANGNANTFAQQYYTQIVDALRNKRYIFLDYFTEEEIDSLLSAADVYESTVNNYSNKVAEATSNFQQSVLQYVPQSRDLYDNLTDVSKDFLSQYIKTFELTAVTTEKDLARMVQDVAQFTDYLAENDNLTGVIKLGMQIQSGTDENGESFSVSKYEDYVSKFTDEFNAQPDDVQIKLRTTFDFDTPSDLNTEVEHAVSHVKNLLNGDLFDSDISDAYKQYISDVEEAENLGIDFTRTIYGNVNTDSRQLLQWNEENLEKYKEALVSWADAGETWEEIKAHYLGSFSTVDGRSENFNGVEIAFTPMLQTENGAEYLSSDTVHNYIEKLIEVANADGSWTTEELLALDAEGLEIDGRRIRDIIADIGDEAIKTGQAMHYSGSLGAIATDYATLEKAAENAGYTVEEVSKAIENGQSIDEMIQDMSVSDVLQIYYNISAEPGSLSFYELQDLLNKIGIDWSKTKNIWDFSEMVEGLDDVESSVSSLVSAMGTLRNGTKLTKGELAKLALEYPELLKVSNLFKDTTVKNQEAMLDSVLGMYESEYDALIDAKVAELEATKTAIDDQVRLENDKKNVVVEIADLQRNGELDSERDYQKLLNQLKDLEGRNYVTYSDGILDVNQDMLEKELEQTSDKVEESKPLFEAQGNLIAESNFKGVNAALKAFPQYATKLRTWSVTSFKSVLSAISYNIREAFSGGDNFVNLLDGIPDIGSVLNPDPIVLETEIENKYTIDSQSVDEWAAEYEKTIEERVRTLTEQRESVQTAIDNLKDLKGLDLTSIYGSTSGKSESGSSSSKETEEYLAEIGRYREALERLSRIRINKESLEYQLSNSDNLEEKIELEKKLMNVYEGEQGVLEEINALRDDTISNGVTALEQMGFKIDYDADSNKFFVRNLEHLNELTANSVGDYDNLQEATNALRKDTEELIDTLEDLNDENQEDSETWRDLYQSIKEAKVNIVNDLKDIVTEASDAVDEIQNVYDTLKAGAKEYIENGGFISVDAFQKIVDLGPEYMQYLYDENDQLVINEDAINRVIAAKTEQLAIEDAMSYLSRIRLALENDSVESLNKLLFATDELSSSTWDLTYAELALMHQIGDLTDEQYQAALHNIDAIRSMADNAIQGLGRTTRAAGASLDDMKNGLDSILEYVMDMLQHQIDEQVDAIEDMKDAYGDLIDLKKESLDASKEETDYQDEVAEKIKEIAKLQERINALSLDDSRDAQAQKAQLQEEMAELQKDLAGVQEDHALDAQKDSLDKMQEAYEDEKDKEIKILEDSIGSEEKLYRAAIEYIQNNWDSLYETLIDWNTEYGSVLNDEISSAWDNCLEAAKRYGSYVGALKNIDADIDSIENGDYNVVSDFNQYDAPSDDAMIRQIIKRMRENSAAWADASKTERERLVKDSEDCGRQLAQYGINAYRGHDGVWYLENGEKLFEKYKYHSGGIAGRTKTFRENELLATLERGEVIVSNHDRESLFALIDFVGKLGKQIDTSNIGGIFPASAKYADAEMSRITNNNSKSVHFGDVYISGANEQTLEKYREINRQFTNEVLKQLNIKR